jgi:hypothetical protein
MATKQELIEGYRMVIRETKRVTGAFTDGDWAKPAQGNEGWNRKQAYCHVAATAEIAPAFLTNLTKAAEGSDGMSGIDIDAFNAQMISSKESQDPKEIVNAIVTSYEKLIEFTNGMPDEQLASRRRFGELEGAVSDVMDSVLVLHAISHVYGAGGSAVV